MKTFTKWHQFLLVWIWTRWVTLQVLCHKEWISVWNSIQRPRFALIKNYSNNFGLLGSEFLRPLFWQWMDPSTTLSFITLFSRILDPSRPSDYFSKFSPRGRRDMSTSQPIHLIYFSWDLWHLLLDTTPLLHPSRRMDPTRKFIRRYQHFIFQFDLVVSFSIKIRVQGTATMRYWKKKTNATFWYWWKRIGSGRSSPDSRWRRFMTVTAARKSDRSRIGAFLPDLFSEIVQFFLYLSYSSEGEQQEWFSCANLSILMHFSSVQLILSCQSRNF